MQLHPCRCGETATTAQTHGLGQSDEGTTSEHDGVCTGCGQRRRFVFRLPGVAPRHTDRYGGSDPSQIIDAAEWRRLALVFMQRAVTLRQRGLEQSKDRDESRSRLEEALDAYREMLKFIPDGREDMPDSAFFTERGRRIRAAEPAVSFQRSFIQAMIDGVRREIAGLK